MASKIIFLKQETNWFAIIPNLIVLSIICLCVYAIDKTTFIFFSIIIYYLLTRLLRWTLIPKSLYSGVRQIRESKFSDAVPDFIETIGFYSKHQWLDKYRFLFLISSSKRTIKESAMCDLSYCYLMIGDVKKAKETYQSVLKEFPDNLNAAHTLNMIDIIEKNANPS